MTTTNGHATLKPGDLTPAVRPVKRTLYVEEETDVGREVWEATDQDLLDECLRRGLLTDEQCREMLSGSDTDSSPTNAAMVPVSGLGMGLPPELNEAVAKAVVGSIVSLGTTPSGEAVRMVGAERAEVERMMPKPSEWIREWCAQSFGATFSNDSQRRDAEIAGIVAYLDEQERLGRGT